MKRNKNFGLISLIIVIIFTAIATSLTTGIIMYSNLKENGTTTVSEDSNLKEFIKVYNQVIDEYYAGVDKKAMINSAIDGMMEYLGDDYSTYMNKSETETLEEQLSGKYTGIGIQLTEGNKIYQIFDNTPASEAGLQVGDIFLKIDDTDVTTYTANEIASKIKSKTGEFSLVVRRGEEELTYNLKIKEIDYPTITSKIIDNNGHNTGYISIDTFSNTASEQFAKNLKELEKQGIENLIIDVRDNTGGYLKAATEISNLFLEKGKVIYSLKNKKNIQTTKDNTKEKREYNVVVLINKSSASASEILASALKDSYSATLVGTTSYGKGKVQQTYSLENGSMIKYTSAKWLRPNGDCIDKIGLTPDYEVELEIDENGYLVNDTQLNKALEILGN